jgi:hypothetical protein
MAKKQANIPTPIEVALYRFGIRLCQAEHLHRENAPSGDFDSGNTRTTADRVSTVRQAFEKLAEAAIQLFEELKAAKPVAEKCNALIKDCQRVWDDWSQLKLKGWGGQEEESNRLFAQIERLREAISGLLRTDSETRLRDRYQSWYDLGYNICDIGETYPRGDTHPSVMRGPFAPPPIISWQNETSLKELMRKVRSSASMLLPALPADDSEIRNRLPYDAHEYEIWFRVEAGLTALDRANQSGKSRGGTATRKLNASDEAVLDALVVKNEETGELVGRALKTNALAEAADVARRKLFGDKDRQRKKRLGIIDRLKKLKLVAHDKVIGFYRLDFLPPELSARENGTKRHQTRH